MNPYKMIAHESRENDKKANHLAKVNTSESWQSDSAWILTVDRVRRPNKTIARGAWATKREQRDHAQIP